GEKSTSALKPHQILKSKSAFSNIVQITYKTEIVDRRIIKKGGVEPIVIIRAVTCFNVAKRNFLFRFLQLDVHRQFVALRNFLQKSDGTELIENLNFIQCIGRNILDGQTRAAAKKRLSFPHHLSHLFSLNSYNSVSVDF